MKLPEIKFPKIPFNYIVVGVIVILILSIIFMTCRNRKEAAVVLHPTQAEIDNANEAKRNHDLFVDSVNKKISLLQSQKDSVVKIVEKKDAEIEVKSLKITALTKQAALAKKYGDEPLFIQSCDSLIPQVNDLVETVDVLQQDNRNVQDAYDSLLGATSLKNARLEYDYSELQERFNKVSSNAINLETSNHKLDKKADKRIILGLQAGGTYSLWQGKLMPYVGFGATYRIARL